MPAGTARASRLLLGGAACGAIALALSFATEHVPGADPVARLQATTQGDLPIGVSVSDSAIVPTTGTSPGEVQSTVIPPGVHRACLDGRLLISNDRVMDPAEVLLVDLDNMSATPAKATFDVPPGWQENDRRIKSNDHDIVALPGGDVLLMKMGQARYAPNNKPVWFDHAYKLIYDKDGILIDYWGPGARSEIFVWRSSDCGNNFTFISSIDTAQVDDAYGAPDDGSGGLPQSDNFEIATPGTPTQPVWQMGGTDGPLVRVDPASGDVYISMALVGNLPLPMQSGFFLSDVLLKRTVVMKSSDRGATWDEAAVLPVSDWRLDIVPRAGGMAFASSGWDLVQKVGFAFIAPFIPEGFVPLPGQPYPASVAPEKNGSWGWNKSPWDHPVLYKSSKNWKAGDYMATNLHGQTLLTRSPSSQNLLIAYMDSIDEVYDGYRLYMFDGQFSWLEFQPILPKVVTEQNFVLHPTAVDPGQGPLLFYWYDVDTVKKTATIRGRLVTRDDTETIDFAVSRLGQVENSFDVTTAIRWYGDYHTAGAYYLEEGRASSMDAYHYYPIWIEADGTLHVTHVKYQIPAEPTFDFSAFFGHFVRPARTILRDEIDVTRLVLLGGEEEDETRRQTTIR